jgi:hypothetical protein
MTHRSSSSVVLVLEIPSAVWIDREQTCKLVDIGKALDAVQNRRMVKPLIKLNPER